MAGDRLSNGITSGSGVVGFTEPFEWLGRQVWPRLPIWSFQQPPGADLYLYVGVAAMVVVAAVLLLMIKPRSVRTVPWPVQAAGAAVLLAIAGFALVPRIEQSDAIGASTVPIPKTCGVVTPSSTSAHTATAVALIAGDTGPCTAIAGLRENGDAAWTASPGFGITLTQLLVTQDGAAGAVARSPGATQDAGFVVVDRSTGAGLWNWSCPTGTLTAATAGSGSFTLTCTPGAAAPQVVYQLDSRSGRRLN